MRIGIYLGLPMWGGGGGSTPPEPPVEWNWQEFDLVNGAEGQWVGYSDGRATLPQPAFGFLEGTPTTVTEVIGLYDDTASGVVLAVFEGDYVAELSGLEVSIGGYVLESFEIELISGNTWVRFSDMPGVWQEGDRYEVTFGFDIPRVPAPVFSVDPEITGTPRVNETLSLSDGVSSDTISRSKLWVVDGVQVGTGDTYVVRYEDVGFDVEGYVDATGQGGTTRGVADSVGPVVADQVAPSISGGEVTYDGSDLIFDDATATGNPTPTVTFSLTRNGTDVTSSRVGDRVSDAPSGDYVATWTASNGVAPNASTQQSLTVTPAGVPWTLADIPPEYRVNGGLWEADNAQTVGGNQISSVPDTWGVRSMSQATSANQPFFGQRGGFNAIVWPDTVGNRRLVASDSFAPVYWAFVMSYNTGVLATFTGAPTIIGNGSVNRVMGLSGSATLWQNVASSWTQQMSKNAGPYSATVLPMPMSLAELKGSAISAAWALGGTQASGGWQGPIHLAMALGIEPTGDLLARIQGFLAWKYGLQGLLPAGHPYKNAPPTKGGPSQALTAIEGGYTVNNYDNDYILTATPEGYTVGRA